MRNPFNDVKANLQRSECLVAQHSDPTKVRSAKQEILRRIDDHTLHILVYGAYNSGKSTLVNALLGEARARVGDVPTTDHIDSYDWEGYRLLDTPGVNAPIDHEKTTAAQLKRTKAVVLVIREGDQDARDVYDRLFEMMRDKKTVFVVVNHQLGNAEEIGALIRKIVDILEQSGGEHGIAVQSLHTIPIFPVNLYTAWNGRSRNQDKLTEHSGFGRFLDAFYDWTRTLDDETHHLSEVKDMVMRLWYAPASGECARRRETPSGEELAQWREKERELAARKNQLHGEASRRTERAIDRVKPNIFNLLRELPSDTDFHSRLPGIIGPAVHEMERWLSDKFGIDSTVSAMANTSFAGTTRDVVDAPGTSVDLESMMKELVQSALEKAADPKVVKDLLLKLRPTDIGKILGLKGRWHTTLGRYAGTISKVAGAATWVLNVVMTIWDAKRAHDKQEEQNRQRLEAVTRLHQAANTVCGDLKRQLLSDVDGIIDQVMDAWISAVRKKIEELRQHASEQEERCQRLADYQAQLETIRF